MSIPYNVVKISNPLSQDNTGKYYAKVKSRGEINLRNLAERISSMSTLSTPDTIAVLEAFIELIPKALLEGYIVKLGDLGSFAPSIKSTGSINKKDFSGKLIKKTSMLFKPGKYIKQKLEKAEYDKI